MAIPTVQPGDSPQFTLQTSIAPDTTPILTIATADATVLASLTAQTSSSTTFWILYTMPNTEGIYKGTWVASKTVAGSSYPFSRAFLFAVKAVTAPR